MEQEKEEKISPCVKALVIGPFEAAAQKRMFAFYKGKAVLLNAGIRARYDDTNGL